MVFWLILQHRGEVSSEVKKNNNSRETPFVTVWDTSFISPLHRQTLHSLLNPYVAQFTSKTEDDGHGKESEENPCSPARGHCHEALIKWVEEEECVPTDKKDACLQKIREKNLAFGEFPFNTEEDAQNFFEVIFGESSLSTRMLGIYAFSYNKKYMGRLYATRV
eukprot:gb/GECG01003019.1/.p1 GENE.gb/GECG01003019.1/~~gb/GECG01003019.1/.p1  ORF type:complete len:164 (+),score=22.13 gb/GECG01003019.1/:1-492(+)